MVKLPYPLERHQYPDRQKLSNHSFFLYYNCISFRHILQ
jgi:hypothetical protein